VLVEMVVLAHMDVAAVVVVEDPLVVLVDRAAVV
jgi:hypothetical protein